MINEISRTKEINKKLMEEGKIKPLTEPEHILAIMEINKAMEEVRMDSNYKQALSWQSAATIILN